MRPRGLPLRTSPDLRKWHRSRALRRAIGKLKRNPRGSDELWRDLVYGWDEAWSAEAEFLDATAAAAVAEDGAILECGSGLTTLVLATIARRTGSSVLALEHDASWLKFVVSALDRFGLSAQVHWSPLQDYGGFEWYDVSGCDLPIFSLVICDGPPASTRGGRFGLLPVLGDRLAQNCLILLDDAERGAEQEVLRLWQSEAQIRYEISGRENRFARVQLRS